MMLADRIAVLRQGTVVQDGPATDIFARLASSFVARFLDVENILEARVIEIAGELATLAIRDQELCASAPAGYVADIDKSGPETSAVRPRRLAL